MTELSNRSRLTLRPLDARFPFTLRRETASLAARLNRWRDAFKIKLTGGDAPTATGEIVAGDVLPDTALTEGVPLREAATPYRIWAAARPFLLACGGIGLLSGLPLRATGFMVLTAALAYLLVGVFLLRRRNQLP